MEEAETYHARLNQKEEAQKQRDLEQQDLAEELNDREEELNEREEEIDKQREEFEEMKSSFEQMAMQTRGEMWRTMEEVGKASGWDEETLLKKRKKFERKWGTLGSTGMQLAALLGRGEGGEEEEDDDDDEENGNDDDDDADEDEEEEDSSDEVNSEEDSSDEDAEESEDDDDVENEEEDEENGPVDPPVVPDTKRKYARDTCCNAANIVGEGVKRVRKPNPKHTDGGGGKGYKG